MESLLRLSGLLPEDDEGATDLGTLERRLAEKAAASGKSVSTPEQDDTTASNTPRQPSPSQSPTTEYTSPEPTVPKKKKEAEVEALSDMMCSLVTNNCGETRYIGMCNVDTSWYNVADMCRLLIRILHLLAQGYPVG
jgi:hypothetical protein